MNVSAWSIRNPVPSILLFVLLTSLGLLSFSRLAVQDFPDLALPTISISAALDGAAASQLEAEVARIIEDQLTGLDRLDSITTTIADGSVSISVAFDVDKDVQEALDEVSSAVDDAQGDLPEGMDAPQVSKNSIAGSALVTLTVRSDRLDEPELSWFIDNDLARALMAVEGVGEVSRLGGIDREVRVELDTDAMTSLGLSASDVNARLAAVQQDLSGGQGEIGGQDQTIRTVGSVASVEDLAQLSIPLPSGGRVRLDEMATVTDTHADRSSLAYLNGEPVVAAQVKRATGYSDLAVTEGIREAVAEFAAEHPEATIEEAYSTEGPIEENYESSLAMIYEGAAIAIVVVFLFLRDWRATFLAAVALPLSILPTFLVMEWLGFSLNTVSLLALSLVVGVLVDDAIVEIENIARHIRMGKSPYDASIEAADEIGLAVIATTFTLVAVFLPTAFMAGIPGLIFEQFGITAAAAVLASLLVARLLTPMMAAYVMKAGSGREERDGPIMRAYLALAGAALRRRWVAMLIVASFLAGTALITGQLATGFFPASDSGQTRVTVTTGPGSALATTDAAAAQAAQRAAGVEGVGSIFTATGAASTGGGPGGGDMSASVTSATLVVGVAEAEDGRRPQAEVEADLRAALADVPGVRVEVGSGGNGTTLQIALAGEDGGLLADAAAALEAELRTLPGIGAVTSSAALEAPEIRVTVNAERSAALGVTAQDIAQTLRVATSGEYDGSLSQLNLPERQVPIRVLVRGADDLDIDRLETLRVQGANGPVALGAVARFEITGAPSQINRLDRSRNVTLSVELNGRALGEVNAEAMALPAYRDLPAGVTPVETGELANQTELFASFATAMAIGVFCIYGVLVLLFRDFLQPVTILMALPLSLGGAFLPLVLTDTAFSLPAVIGLLMLMGIVTKNSILLVEYAVMAQRRGMGRFEALMDACHKRARPIVMTTIAMVGGMLPAALNWSGGDGAFRQPMAYVVIGGLLTSTVLSLLVIPVVFTYVDDLLGLMVRLVGRGRETGRPGSAQATLRPSAGHLPTVRSS